MLYFIFERILNLQVTLIAPLPILRLLNHPFAVPCEKNIIVGTISLYLYTLNKKIPYSSFENLDENLDLYSNSSLSYR